MNTSQSNHRVLCALTFLECAELREKSYVRIAAFCDNVQKYIKLAKENIMMLGKNYIVV